MSNPNEFYTRTSIEERIAVIKSNTTKNNLPGETAPDGRDLSEVNARLYQQLEFLQSVLEQSVIAFPVKLP
jgi:hypothetical protein